MMDLISKLTSELNIDETQAKGGVGSILKMAQDKLDGGDFSKLAGVFGGESNVTSLLGAAPSGDSAGGGAMGMLGSAVSALGANNLGDMASLAGTLKGLNIDMGTITKFAPMVMDWAKTQGGDDIMGILKKVL